MSTHHDAMADLEQWLHEAHGHRIVMLRQHLREGDPEAAMRSYWQSHAFAMVCKALHEITQTGDLPDRDEKPQYRPISEAVLAAGRQARAEQRGGEQSAGLKGLE